MTRTLAASLWAALLAGCGGDDDAPIDTDTDVSPYTNTLTESGPPPQIATVHPPRCSEDFTTWVVELDMTGRGDGNNLFNLWSVILGNRWNEEHDLPGDTHPLMSLAPGATPSTWLRNANTALLCEVPIDQVIFAYRVYDLAGNLSDCTWAYGSQELAEQAGALDLLGMNWPNAIGTPDDFLFGCEVVTFGR